MANDVTAQVHKAMTWSIVLSVLMIVTGVLAIGLPLVAGVAFERIVAWLLIFSAALHLAFAWRGHSAGGVLWEILLGLTYGVCGAYLWARPLVGLAAITLAVAIYLLAKAILEFVQWFQRPTAPGRAWLCVDGIISLVLAVMIWSTWPSSAAWVVGTLVGFSMLFSGLSRLVLSLAVRRLAV